MLGGLRVWAVIIVIGLVASAWGFFLFQKAQIESLKTSLDNERALRAAAEASLALNELATSEAEISRQVDNASVDLVALAQQEIANAETAHDLYVVWVAGVERLRDGAAASA